MESVFGGFATIVMVIALGVLLTQLGLFDRGAEAVLTTMAFYVASPALLLTTVAGADVHALFTANLIATAVGVAVPAAVYAVCARRIWHRNTGESVIGSLASSYVNAGNLGLPVATYVLGSTAVIAPTLLLQLLVLQPVALTILDVERQGRRPRLLDVVRTPLANPLTVATLVGGLAVPAMLIAFGIALRLGPGLGGDIPRGELALTTALKLMVQPLVAYAVARFALGLPDPAAPLVDAAYRSNTRFDEIGRI